MNRQRLHFCMICLLAAMLGLSVPAPAQTGVCTPLAGDRGTSHAWAIVPDHVARAEAGACVLVHAPPRNGDHATDSGFVQLARTFQEWPRALAGWCQRVYLVFQQPGKDGATLVRVRSLSAVDRGLGWDYEPFDRLDPYPTLVTRGDVTSSAAWNDLLLIVRRLDDGAHAFDLLEREVWSGLELPGPPDGQWIAWSSQDGLSVGRIGSDGMHVWTMLRDAAGRSEWVTQPGYAARPNRQHFAFGGSLVEVEREQAQLVVRMLLPGEAPIRTATLPVGERATVMPLCGDGPRLMVLRWDDANQNPGDYPRLEVLEMSVGTGVVLYEGTAPRSNVLSPGEFRMLATMLVALLIGVLVIVLKGDLDHDAVPLPPDTALAGAGRRLLGSLIDLVIAAHVTALLYGVKASDLLGLSVLVQPGGQWTAVPMLFIVGGVIGTLCEWGFSRTIGKFLVGCRVVRVRGKVGARPGLVACLIRNGIKWLMPPVAALAALDQNTRHRGDQLAGVAVVIDLEPVVPGD